MSFAQLKAFLRPYVVYVNKERFASTCSYLLKEFNDVGGVWTTGRTVEFSKLVARLRLDIVHGSCLGDATKFEN
jgi:hypothetical protein